MKSELLLLMLLFTGISEAAISKHRNSLGVVQYEDNPYQYTIGSVVTGFDIDDGKGLVIRVQPLATYNLFSEDILFCGNPIGMLENKHNPVALTYEKVSHRTVRGIGCHDLVRVDELKEIKVR